MSDPVPTQPAVLVVEDDASISFLLQFILRQKGWRPIVAMDGRQGLQAIEEGERTELVLLDLMLPEVDGITLLQRLRAQPRWQGVPVLMLTARGDEATMARAQAAGASDFLAKPFEPAQLMARLDRLSGRSAS